MIWVLLACGTPGDDTGAVAAEDIAVADATCERDPPLDWDNFAHGFFQRYCTSCHTVSLGDTQRSGAPVGVDFDSEDQVRGWGLALESYVLGGEASMPPGGGPTTEELQMLAEWIGCAS